MNLVEHLTLVLPLNRFDTYHGSYSFLSLSSLSLSLSISFSLFIFHFSLSPSVSLSPLCFSLSPPLSFSLSYLFFLLYVIDLLSVFHANKQSCQNSQSITHHTVGMTWLAADSYACISGNVHYTC